MSLYAAERAKANPEAIMLPLCSQIALWLIKEGPNLSIMTTRQIYFIVEYKTSYGLPASRMHGCCASPFVPLLAVRRCSLLLSPLVCQ